MIVSIIRRRGTGITPGAPIVQYQQTLGKQKYLTGSKFGTQGATAKNLPADLTKICAPAPCLPAGVTIVGVESALTYAPIVKPPPLWKITYPTYITATAIF